MRWSGTFGSAAQISRVLLVSATLAGCSDAGSSKSNAAGAGGTGGATSSGGSGANAGNSSGGNAGTGAAASGGVLGSGRSFPDSSSTIAILSDQLPGSLSPEQQQFVVDHFVGTQKLTLNQSAPLRALNPNFLVLHYHLAMWQSAPNVSFIVDGNTWSNDYPEVTTHESWFWHNEAGDRVASNQDGKLLMNIGDSGFDDYWTTSLESQVNAGDYDAIFFDSASPDLLQWEAQSPPDPRLSGTGVRDNTFTEFGGTSWIAGWEQWIGALDGALGAKGIPLIPNTGAFITSWDTTDYSRSAGIFSEGFCDPSFATSDWTAAVNETLKLVNLNKIVILQNYLASTDDLAKRRYLLANYLLVKGKRTYLFYFANSTLEWYPEWGLDLGAAQSTATSVADLASGSVFRRDFANGIVLVNPTDTLANVVLGGTFKRVVPQGGGAIPTDGTAPGSIVASDVTSIDVPAKGAEILLR